MERPRPEPAAQEDYWLDADQQQSWRHLFALLMTLPAAIESDLQRTTGITMFEYLVLANLSEADETTLRMTELAYRANSSLSRLSHVVSRLVKRGWVRKRPSANDGRVSEVVLTKAGLAKVVGAAPDHARLIQELVIAPLTRPQLKALGASAAAIVERIAQRNNTTTNRD
ncbi:MAG TPA: MarR family transcriptional regulator [Mycobacterium sp.]|nr:MarR family transcriptional regulator [Mycobacterium sp.]